MVRKWLKVIRRWIEDDKKMKKHKINLGNNILQYSN